MHPVGTVPVVTQCAAEAIEEQVTAVHVLEKNGEPTAANTEPLKPALHAHPAGTVPVVTHLAVEAMEEQVTAVHTPVKKFGPAVDAPIVPE